MEAEVIYYCEDYDDVGFTTLVERFGTPENVAKDFLSELGENAATEAYSIKRKVLYLCVAIIIVIGIGAVLHTSYVQHTLLDIQYVESITSDGNIATYATAPIYSSESFGNEGNPDK